MPVQSNPNLSATVVVVSNISASIITWGVRTSSLEITSSIITNWLGTSVIIRLLDLLSATIFPFADIMPLRTDNICASSSVSLPASLPSEGGDDNWAYFNSYIFVIVSTAGLPDSLTINILLPGFCSYVRLFAFII